MNTKQIISELSKLEDNLITIAQDIKRLYFANERYFADHAKRFERMGLDNPPYSYGSQGELSESFDKEEWNKFTNGNGPSFEQELQDTYTYYNTLQYLADCEGYGIGAASRGFDVTKPIGMIWSYSTRCLHILLTMASLTNTKIDTNKRL